MKKLYIAIPYRNNPEYSFEIANFVSAELMKKGYIVFSPISHSHPIGLVMNKQFDHEFWMNQDLPFLKFCDELIVICIEGWKESKGVQEEIAMAKLLKKKIVYIADYSFSNF
jgi:hypothetical protein